MSTLQENVLVNVVSRGVVDVGELRIAKTSLGVKRGGERYLIYLPINRNYLWKVLHDKKVRVRIYIEIPQEVLTNEARKREAESEREEA